MDNANGRFRKHAIAWAALAAATWCAAAGASLMQIAPSAPTDTFDAEPGQSIPTGVTGVVDGVLSALTAGTFTFTYGPGDLVPGATGHGNSAFLNEFWVGASESAARAAGHIFCTQAIQGVCAASMVGDSFSVDLGAGALTFGFTFGARHENTIANGAGNQALGAYLVTLSLGNGGTVGPGYVAYVGLTDQAYPGIDHDFQDLTVRIASSAPEPQSLALVGLGLAAALGAATLRRRGWATG